ncbi:T-cell-specific guanine nucleotide triphosphate-binding protein 2-like [Mercenaria mercenaria]|uniref:T-cell-specific guanine nucleotide triphosphate-binding protein 2-like n=1 Tax=Mercenaria mercenaria TaxID=6596 RepID=UPI00234FAA91|nr:T-cell-specific guanine nucleotide triphosphate-binding protein 2-like [Mercenaria mercenaria]
MAYVLNWTKKKLQKIFSELKRVLTVQGSNITEEVKQYEEELEKYGISGLRRKVQGDLDRWQTIPVHFAVIGRSGEGKSAFINALIDGSDKEIAAVGIKETTTEVQEYQYPKHPNIVLHDLPGVGTKRFPKAKYLKDVKIDQYDCFFLITSNRFTEDEQWIADEIKKRGKKFYFMRTAIDSTIASEQKRRKKFKQSELVVADLCEEVRIACAENLDKHSDIFLIDNFDDEAFDFPKLRERLLEDLPIIKAQTLALSFSALTGKVLAKKRDMLLYQIPKKSTSNNYDRK